MRIIFNNGSVLDSNNINNVIIENEEECNLLKSAIYIFHETDDVKTEADNEQDR